ncbi:Atu4866 domain-containing protein [Actinoplanes sp. NBRC 101535]|uniref:Atu4866 domain-containing protein n=1 Tax=Actinoplanes sp. NBRC 101535 TaxID=3032196 RepID=UPI0024A4F9FA|nr:Atu4866 domain-containing protein [Actinoplanes sp. NBRC 101535]GLY02666.1 hypothetical protein Acsp01_30450 [Actinoplanes sp. NBRC 101535]
MSTLFANTTIYTPQPVRGDLLVGGTRIVAVGPDLDGRGAKTVDGTGRSVVPLTCPLTPGSPATFALVPAISGPFERSLWWPSPEIAVFDEGERVTSFLPGPPPSDSPLLGTWIDATGFIHQHLTADGRYDETRGGRPHAYQGSFWMVGDHIVYRDDLGFWAYGRFDGETLHHAGYTFARK